MDCDTAARTPSHGMPYCPPLFGCPGASAHAHVVPHLGMMDDRPRPQRIILKIFGTPSAVRWRLLVSFGTLGVCWWNRSALWSPATWPHDQRVSKNRHKMHTVTVKGPGRQMRRPGPIAGAVPVQCWCPGRGAGGGGGGFQNFVRLLCWVLSILTTHKFGGGGGSRDAVERTGPQRRPQKVR